MLKVRHREQCIQVKERSGAICVNENQKILLRLNIKLIGKKNVCYSNLAFSLIQNQCLRSLLTGKFLQL